MVVLMLLTGCRGDGRTYGNVQGRVTFEGKPVREAIVVFQDVQQHVYMQTKTDQDGQYDLSHLKGRGLSVGTYQVAVQRPIQDIRTGEPPPTPLPFPPIDAKYSNPDTSTLQIEVGPGMNRFDITLHSAI